MKLANTIHWLAIGLTTLSLGVTSCSKNPQRTTNLGGTGPGAITDDRNRRPIDGGLTVAPPIDAVASSDTTPVRPTEGGIPQANGDFTGWTENPDEFKNQTVYFDYDKANVKPSEVEKLKEVARRMKSSFQGKALRIEGHCDERGTEEYNRTLGDKRAQAIRELLASEGVDPTMMPTITLGEDKPADPGHNEAAYSKNRRGELVLLSPPRQSGEQLTPELGATRALRNSE